MSAFLKRINRNNIIEGFRIKYRKLLVTKKRPGKQTRTQISKSAQFQCCLFIRMRKSYPVNSNSFQRRCVYFSRSTGAPSHFAQRLTWVSGRILGWEDRGHRGEKNPFRKVWYLGYSHPLFLFFSFLFFGEFWVEYSYVPVCQSYALVCYSYVLVCFSYATRMVPVCIRMLPVCTRMYSYVTRMYPHVTRMSPVWCISHDQLELGYELISFSLGWHGIFSHKVDPTIRRLFLSFYFYT